MEAGHDDWRETRRRLARRAIPLVKAGIVAVFGYGVLTWNPSVMVNALFGLGVSYLPAVVARDYNLRLSPGLVFLVALAIFLHTLGMVGLYTKTAWWDHVTHALSAIVIASISYATVVALDIHRDDLRFPPTFLAVFLLATTLGFGVLWEVLEFAARALGRHVGAKPVLVVYGVGDVTLDLVYNAIGGVIVATVGTYRLRHDVLRITLWLETERD